MAKTIRITIATEPVSKGRPRTTYQHGVVRTYTPTRTVEAQEFIQARLARHIEDKFPPDTPIRLSVTFFRTKSRYLPKRETMPFRKSDLDNFLKLILDAMNGILVADDAQFTTIIARKRWADNGEGHIDIKLEEDQP